MLAEEVVAFDRELSILAVRGRDGETAFYPLVENAHRDGILRRLARARGRRARAQAARDYAARLLDALGYVGVLALELFELKDGALLANEIAPRVHNSGHWTIEGARDEPVREPPARDARPAARLDRDAPSRSRWST